MSYELWAMSNCKLKTAHGSKPVAHSKKENYEKDITTYISVIIIGNYFRAEQVCAFKRDFRFDVTSWRMDNNQQLCRQLVGSIEQQSRRRSQRIKIQQLT